LRNLVKFGHVDFEIYASGQTERQTNRHTYTMIAIRHPPTRGEIIIIKICSKRR